MRHRQPLLGILLAATLLAGIAAPALAAGSAEAGTLLHRKDVEVLADDGAGWVTVSLFAREAGLLEAYSAASFEVLPLYELPAAAERGPQPEIDAFQPRDFAEPPLRLAFDTSGLVARDGVLGYQVIVRGGVPAGDDGVSLVLRKPTTWRVITHYVWADDEVGIKALVRCHFADMWAYWAGWTLIFYNQTHCPPHGAVLYVPGDPTKIEVEFDGAYFTQYEIWGDGTHWVYTFYPGPIDP